jgi:hypothetical protein
VPRNRDAYTSDGKFYLDENGEITKQASIDAENDGLLGHIRIFNTHSICLMDRQTRNSLDNCRTAPIEFQQDWKPDEMMRFALCVLRANGTPAALFAAGQLQAMIKGMAGDNSPVLGGDGAT